MKPSLGLFINVIKPANIPAGKKLPVLFVRSHLLISTIKANIEFLSSGFMVVCSSHLEATYCRHELLLRRLPRRRYLPKPR